ncbi:MAG: non-hydrolyzing UDP-N-acetylglucosamine 2-epimerase, partial [Nitrosopumilaceae archaeon]
MVLGTRPEFMKMSPVIRELERRKIEHFVIHTGQHYSYVLDRIFFENLRLKEPDYNLNVGPKSPGGQTGSIIEKMDKILQTKRPSVVLVPGDTHTSLAGAIAARKLDIPIGHVESGLRSYDELMPEEWNRRMIDHCSDFLFAPTNISRNILLGEGIPRSKIFVTGNTIVDAVLQNLKYVKNSNVIERLGLVSGNYFLTSIHRKENVTNH